MRDLIDLKGASGAVYRFALCREGRPLSPMGGNFVYVRATGDSYELIHVGEVQNLLKDARDRWAKAVEMLLDDLARMRALQTVGSLAQVFQ